MPRSGKKETSQYMTRKDAEALAKWIEGYLRDCRFHDLSAHTVEYYRLQLADFAKFCQARAVAEISDITPDLIRAYLLQLQETGHDPGGRHAKYRALRAFLHWYEREVEPEGWHNPIAKVKAPKVIHAPIEGVSLEDIRAMLATCANGFIGARDKAIILFLFDTGARVNEFLSLDLDDVDFIGGGVLIRMGKGRRARTVFIGRKTRRAVRAYLKQRTDSAPALRVTSQGDRLAVSSLRGMLTRRGQSAGVTPPSPHDFRRGFALVMLRAGTDV